MQIHDSEGTQGFSLLEVLVATALLSGALLSLAQVLAIDTNASASSGRATRAAVLAADQIETLESLSWDSLRSRLGESVERLDPGFIRRSIIEPLSADPDDTLVIEVVVSGRREEVRVATLRARTAP